MMTSGALQFLSGMIVMCDLVATLFFLKFWSRGSDRLFAYFTIAFVILAIQRTVLTLGDPTESAKLLTYGLRAVAFLVLIVGIVDKNRAASR